MHTDYKVPLHYVKFCTFDLIHLRSTHHVLKATTYHTPRQQHLDVSDTSLFPLGKILTEKETRVLILASNIVITIVFLPSGYLLDSLIIYIVTCKLA